MEKYLSEDGKSVAVIISSKLAWSTWATEDSFKEYLIFDKELVKLVLDKASPETIIEHVPVNYREQSNISEWNANKLSVLWIPVNVKFAIVDTFAGETLFFEDEIYFTVS
jgi:hypothetical protein